MFDFNKLFHEKMEELGEDVDNLLREKEAVNSHLMDDISHYKRELEEATSNLQAEARSRHNLESNNERLNGKIADLLDKIEVVEEEKRHISSKNKKLNMEVGRLVRRVEEVQKELEKRESFHESRYNKVNAEKGKVVLENQRLKGEA